VRYDTIPVKSASANVSFYTNNSKIPNFELWHSCRKWAIYFTFALYVGKLLFLRCRLLTFQSTIFESSGMGDCVKQHCYNTGSFRLSLNTSNTPIFLKEVFFCLKVKISIQNKMD
jgi:hypothetical protein